MSTVKGVVKRVGEAKTGKIKRGKRIGKTWDKRSVLIEDDWYGGFINEDNKEALNAVEEGFTVEMEVEEKDGYKNFKEFKIISKSVSQKSDSGEEVVDNYQFRTTYGFAAGRALSFVELLFSVVGDPVKAGLIPKVEKKQAEAVELLVEKYTNLFAEQAWNAWPEEEGDEEEVYDTEEDTEDDEYE